MFKQIETNNTKKFSKVELTTDVFGHYFITNTFDEVIPKGHCSNLVFFKEEIHNVGYDDLFSFKCEHNLKPNKKYICEWFLDIDKNYYGEILDCIPTIVSIKEI